MCLFATTYRLEEFTATHQDTLSNFATLLEHPKASSMKEESILKYMAINIFSIHNLLEKNSESIILVIQFLLPMVLGGIQCPAAEKFWKCLVEKMSGQAKFSQGVMSSQGKCSLENSGQGNGMTFR